MQTTLAIREAMAQLLAADPDTLAPVADNNHAVLLMAQFSPNELLTMGDLVPATFDGATPLLAGLGTQAEGLDPATLDAIITIKAPIGGWRWETTGITNLPQTIYGIALTNKDEDLLLASMRFETPIVLTGLNQVINVGPLTLRQLAGTVV